MPIHKKGSAMGIRTLSRATILRTIRLTYLYSQCIHRHQCHVKLSNGILYTGKQPDSVPWSHHVLSLTTFATRLAIAAGQNGPWHNPLTGVTLAQVNIRQAKQIRHDKVNSRQANCEKRFGMRRAARGSKLFMRVYERSAANSNWLVEERWRIKSIGVYPPTHQSVRPSVSFYRADPDYPRLCRWPIRLPRQFPPIIRSLPSCFATVYTWKFIVCLANEHSLLENRSYLSANSRVQLSQINHRGLPHHVNSSARSLLIIAPSKDFLTLGMLVVHDTHDTAWRYSRVRC